MALAENDAILAACRARSLHASRHAGAPTALKWYTDSMLSRHNTPVNCSHVAHGQGSEATSREDLRLRPGVWCAQSEARHPPDSAVRDRLPGIYPSGGTPYLLLRREHPLAYIM